MKNLIIYTSLMLIGSFALAQSRTPEVIPTDSGDLKIYPVLHATMALQYQDQMIYTDPYGGLVAFNNLASPTLILITDIHGDHMNLETLQELEAQNIPIIAPQAVADQLGEAYTQVTALNNGETISVAGLQIEALPMYNLPEDSTSRHTKGRGNGYVLTIGGKRIYISGDTEDIVEMRQLQQIDIAFICMNQPYTMTIEAAADAVLEFRPKMVYPFHYRGKEGFSDVNNFKRLINVSSDQIEVRLLNWYPEY